MKKQYFLQFDYTSIEFDKFYFGVVEVDLTKISLNQLCGEIVESLLNTEQTKINLEGITIKVNTFNNIN